MKYYCKECRKEITSGSKLGRCRSCAIKYRWKIGSLKIRTGRKHSSYKDGRSLRKYYCIDCGKEIWYRSIRCKPCSHKGQNAPCYKDGRTMKKHYCKDCGIKISWGAIRCQKCNTIEQHKLHPRKGKNNPNYIEGLNRKYPLEFEYSLKELIRNRDNRKCQVCRVPEVECYRKLDIHHIDYDKENLASINLISLCSKCHMKTNYNRDYWYAYFTYIMET